MLAGVNHSRGKRFYDDGAAAVVTPGFAPKRDWCADRRAAPDNQPHGGLEIGEQQVRGHRWVKTRVRSGAGIKPGATSWLVVSDTSMLRTECLLARFSGDCSDGRSIPWPLNLVDSCKLGGP